MQKNIHRLRIFCDIKSGLIRESPSVTRTMSNNALVFNPANLALHSTVSLLSGHSMPILGYGVYQTPQDVCRSVCLHALKAGYRHIDSARAYRNEAPCAEAISASGLSRSEVFFTSKVPPRDLSYNSAKNAIAKTLQETGLGYIDLYLIHAPYGGRKAREGAWRALSEAQQQGLVRSIGVSNFGVHHLEELQEFISEHGLGRIDVGQWELHPWLPREDIVNWGRRHGVVIQAWSPLVRAQRFDEQVLKNIAAKHGKTMAQVLVRWSLEKGFVPLPKSVTASRIEENNDVYNFQLDEDDLEQLHFPNSYAPCSWDPTVSHS